MVLKAIERFQYAGLRELGIGIFHIKLCEVKKKKKKKKKKKIDLNYT